VSYVSKALIAPDQSFIVTVDYSSIYIWNYDTLAPIASHGGGNVITAIDISPFDKTIIASYLSDGMFYIIDGTNFLLTITQIPALPNQAHTYSIVFCENQFVYYMGGYQPSSPEIIELDTRTNLQTRPGIATNFVNANIITDMDVY